MDASLRNYIFKLCWVLPLVAILVTYHTTQDWALYSEEAVLNASVTHPLFVTEEHFAKEFWRPEMQQKDRIQGLNVAIHGAKRALETAGLRPFLESASLIGWMRHGKGQIPWDSDGDLGVIQEECENLLVTKADVEKALGPDSEVVVMKFACRCEEDCEGDNKRMAGRFAHRGTGVTIDVFMYAPVAKRRPWQAEGPNGEKEWWERVDDHADYTFPKESLLPLREDTFVGQPILIPSKPQEFLGWEYGRCLEPHIWPWKLLLYTPLWDRTMPAVGMKAGLMLMGSKSARGFTQAYHYVALGAAYDAIIFQAFDNGVCVALLLLNCVFQLIAYQLADKRWLGQRDYLFRRGVVFIGLILVSQLQTTFDHLLCSIDDYYFHPQRPKIWTLCLFGKCWDFGA